MDKIITMLIILILLLFLLWCYVKYCEKNEENKIKYLSNLIKNNITITLYNIKQFIDLSSEMKLILLDVATKYKHNDIIKILQ